MAQTVNGGNIRFGVGFDVDQSSLKKLQDSLFKIQTMKFDSNFKGTRDELKLVQQTATKVQEALQKAFNVNLGSLNIEKFNKALGDLKIDKIYQDFSKAGIQGQTAFSQMTSQVLNTNLKLKLTKSIVDSLGQTFMNSIKWNIASSAINAISGSLNLAFGYVKNLDSSLTNIRIVTGDSRELMAQFAVEANKAAAALGRTTREYTDAALSFYQQGLNDEEVRVRTEASLKAKNITQGQASVDELTAVWNGYQVSIELTLKYVDKLAAVADSSASDMSLLATAMSKVAATANVMGVDIDQLTAQIATIVATTRQAPQTVGNALKTIYARINDIKAGTDEAEVSLGNYTGKMASLGINVLDANNLLRDTGEVMEEIGERWGTLTREQQVYLAQTMAGQRQYNQLISLFDNWTQYSEMLNVSLESEGTLNLKNARYMESLAAHIEQFTAARLNLMDSILNADSMKNFVDLGTNIVNVLAKIVDTAGGGGNAILAIGSALTTLFHNQIGAEINNIIVNFQNIKDNAKLIAAQIQEVYTYGASEGMQNKSVQEMVTAHAEMAKYASALSNEQRVQYNQLVELIGKASDLLSIEEQRNLLGKKLQLILRLHNLTLDNLLNTLEKIKELNTSLNSINKKPTDIVSEKLAEKIRYLILLVKQLNEVTGNNSDKAREFAQTWAQVGEDTTFTGDQVATLRRQIEEFYNSANQKENNLSHWLLDSGHKAKLLEQELQQLRDKAQSFQDQTKQLWSTQSVVSMVGAVGQLITMITALSNGVKTILDPTKTFELKIKAIGAILAFTIPQALNIYKNTIGELIKAGMARLLAEKIEQKIILEKNAAEKTILAEKKQQTAELKKQTAELLKQKAIEKKELADSYKVGATGRVYKKGKKGAVNPQEARQAQMAADFAGKNADTAEDIAKRAALLANEAAKAANNAEDAFKNFKGLATSAFDGLKTSLSTFGKNFATLMAPPTGLIIAGLVAAAAAAYGLYKWWNKDAEAAEKAAKTAEKAKLHYKELKDTINEFNSSISAYDESVDALNKLVKGTDLWNLKLKETNEQVLELLLKYPQLANAIHQNSDGLLVIDKLSEDYLNYVLSLNNELTAANVAKVGSQAASDKAQRESLLTDTARSLPGVDRNTLEKIVNAQQSGNNVLGDLGKLKELLKEGMSSAELHSPQLLHNLDLTVEAIKNGKTEISTLITTLDTNTKATLILATTVSQDLLKDNPDYQNSKYQDVYTLGINNLIENASLKPDDIRNQVQGRGALIASYKELFGEDSIKTNALGRNIRIKNASGQYLEADLDRLKSAVAAAEATKHADLEVQKITLHIANAEKEFGDFALSALKFRNIKGAEDLDKIVNSLSGDEITKFTGQAQDLIKAFDLEGVIDEKQLTDSLKAAADKALDNTRDYINNNKLLASAFSKIGNLKLISDKISPLLRQQIGLIFNKGLKIDPKYADNIGLLFKDVLDAGKLDEFLDLDFASSNLLELKNSLKELGIQTDLSDLKLLAFLNTIQGFNPNNANITLNRNTLNLASKQNSGEDLDDEEAKQLTTGLLHLKQLYPLLTAQVDILNQKWLAGTQQYTQALEAVKDADNYATALRIKNAGEAAAAMKEEYTNGLTSAADALDAFETGVLLTGDKIPDSLAMTATSLSLLDDLLQYGAISGQAFASALQSVSDTEIASHGIDVDKFEAFCDLLRDTNPELALNEFLLRSLAETQIRISEGTLSLIDNWDDFNDAILDFKLSGNVYDLALSWDELRQTIGNLFDMDLETLDLLGPDFVANNWDKIQAVKDGVEGAWLDMNATMTQQILMNVTANLDPAAADRISWDFQNLTSYMQDLGDLTATITPEMDESHILESMNRIATAAGWTSEQAQAAFSQMGYDVLVEAIDPKKIPDSEKTEYYIPPTYHMLTQTGLFDYAGTPMSVSLPVMDSEASVGSVSMGKLTYMPGAYSIKTATPNGRSSGGNISRKAVNSAAPRKAGGGGGGKKGGGGGSKGSQPKKAKVEKVKKDKTDPYHMVNRSLDEQLKKLKEIQLLEKDGLLKDKLKAILALNKNYEQQIKLLKEKEAIADAEQARLKNEIKAGSSNVKVNFTATGEIANYNQVLDGALKKYNDWITNVYNKWSAEEQLAHAALKLAREQEYEQLKKNMEEYEKNLDLHKDIAEALRQIKREQTELYLNAMKYNLDAKKNAGELLRNWQDFSDKVIRNIADDDYMSQIQSRFSKIQSYINSELTKLRSEQIKALQNELDRALAGEATEHTADEIQKRLELLYKEQMDDLEAIRDLQNEIQEQFLNSLDNVGDKFEKVIDQYERINDVLEYGTDLTQKLYGDQAYDQLNKFSDQLYQNNLKTLLTLNAQRQYWINLMNNSEVGSEAWNRAREFFEDVQDQLNDKILEALDNLNDWWDARIEQMADKLTRALANGLNDGLINGDWDRISKMDDTFLDDVNRTYGVGEIEDMYQAGVDSLADSPKLQQRLNKLMKEQLSLLNDKDKLTQYDLDRAKALYDILMKRYELELARNNKTKMRLRRDSQGNYTYQYVEDELKLNDLQSALAKALNDLYNNDKEEYKKNLDEMYETYKQYMEDRALLVKQQEQLLAELANAETSEERKAQIREELFKVDGAIKDLDNWYNNYAEGIMGNIATIKEKYLPQSISMNLDLDVESMTPEEKSKLTDSYVSFAKSALQGFASTIEAEGGVMQSIINPIKDQMDLLVQNYLTRAELIMNQATTVPEQLTNTEVLLSFDLGQAQNAVQVYSNIKDVLKLINDYLTNINWDNYISQLESVSKTLLEAYTMVDKVAQKNTTDQLSNITPETEALKVLGNGNLDATGTGGTTDNPVTDTMQDKIVTGVGNDATAAAALREGNLSSAIAGMVGGFGTLINNGNIENNYNIYASFPNATDTQSIKDAILNLPITASQQASTKSY